MGLEPRFSVRAPWLRIVPVNVCVWLLSVSFGFFFIFIFCHFCFSDVHWAHPVRAATTAHFCGSLIRLVLFLYFQLQFQIDLFFFVVSFYSCFVA